MLYKVILVLYGLFCLVAYVAVVCWGIMRDWRG